MPLIITSASHIDHEGVTPKLLKLFLDSFKDRESFFIETFSLEHNKHLPLPCALYGPAVGDLPVPEDVVVYAQRPGRTNNSRLVHRPLRLTNTVTVIAGPDKEGNKCVLYTCYGGPASPREPTDPFITDPAEMEKSKMFWSQHALTTQTVVDS